VIADGARQGLIRSLGAVLFIVIRPALHSRRAAGARLLADWAVIVGPALAAATRPLRLEAGTLTIACNGPTAMEVQYAAARLIERVNTYLGRPSVERLRCAQQPVAASGLAEPSPNLICPSPPPPSDCRARSLDEALAALGRAVAAHVTPSVTPSSSAVEGAIPLATAGLAGTPPHSR
jgi:hypothetical protein